MNQRVAVRAIIKKDNRILLLRKASGRATILGKYELPGGRLDDGEQPSDALSRHIENDTGFTIQTAQLQNAVTYIDHDDRDLQYVLILYHVGLEGDGSKLRLSQNYDHYIWKEMSELHHNAITESSQLLLGLTVENTTPSLTDRSNSLDDITTTDISRVVVYSDGGSRGNPGPSAAGFIVMDDYERVLHEDGTYLGITTNNQAEYHGVILGLQKAYDLGARTVEFRMDSLLVVNQLNGIYKIKNRELWPLNERVQELVSKFDKVKFTHVRREFNRLADQMVNKILDAQVSGKV